MGSQNQGRRKEQMPSFGFRYPEGIHSHLGHAPSQYSQPPRTVICLWGRQISAGCVRVLRH